MAIYTIGDLHLSLGCEKPMDIFPGWQGYMEKLEHHWNTLVRPEDTVVLAGDTSWAMKLEDTAADFSFLQRLPGQKLLLKGNHDYWWTTMKKMETYLADQGFSSLGFLFNNARLVEGVWLCGTRGWMFDQGEVHDRKVIDRETGRLRLSLSAAQGEEEKVCFLHYPPIFGTSSTPEILEVMKEYGVRRCYYGHLHGKSIHYGVQGEVDGIQYRLTSADGLGFCPLKI